MTGPLFAVLDVVVIRDSPELRKLGLAGRRGSVTAIRRYEDGRYRYSLGSDDVDVGGIYDETDLEPTGERADISVYQLPGPFRERDVSRISDDFFDLAIAGRQAVVDGSYVDDDAGLLLGLWVEELSKGFAVPPAALRATGERRPPEPRGRSCTATLVSADGEPVRTEVYAIVDEVAHYL